MATKKALAKNPAPSQPKQNGQKPAQKASSKKPATSSKKPKSQTRNYRTNTAATQAQGILGAFVGAGIIQTFDLIINYFFPSISATIRTLGKFGVGYAVGSFGAKVPVVGKYSGTVRNSLYLAGALDVLSTYVMPYAAQYISGFQMPTALQNLLGTTPATGASLVPAGTTTNANGDLGQVLYMPNGDRVEVFDGRRPQRTLLPQGYEPNASLIPYRRQMATV